jgi:serine/threonine protein kinase
MQVISQARNEYQLALQCANLSSNIQKLIDHKEVTDEDSGKQYIELLYEHFENDLSSVIGKLNVKESVNIMRKVLKPLAVMEENGIFHSDLKPENISMEGKILNCGSSISFGQKMKLMRLGKLPKSELLYYPPEVICTEEYVLNKVDVYSWGMIFYQMLTGKSKENLEEELELRLTDHNKFLEGFDKIEFANNTLKEDIIELMNKVLNLNNKCRPTFKQILDCMLNRDYYKGKYVATRELLGKAELERGIFQNNT